MRPIAFLTALLLFWMSVPGAAREHERTLADIRQELSELYVEILKLQRELSPTENAEVVVGGDVLQRVDLIEGELRRITASAELLEFRLSRIVRDGTNRIGDLEFRLCELETDCDISSLGRTPTLGGEVAVTPEDPEPEELTGDTQMAVSEQADFDRAKAAFDDGDFRVAADLFEEFSETYIGGSLEGEVHFLRGEALSGLGDTTGAARAYLESSSGYPDGPNAAAALFRLGVSLAELGQTGEACEALRQIGTRFPGRPRVAEADAERHRLGCP